jgi:hypothetical protein
MNTAGRLLSTHQRLLNHGLGNDPSMLKVWAHVFDLSAEDPQLEDAVVMCLQATRSEIEVLRTRLAVLGVPEDLMHPGLSRLRNHTSTANINASWNNFREEATKPENQLSFKWANWALRDEDEEVMPADELAALRSELDSLEMSLRDSDMTPYLSSYVQRQIDAIRSALRVYRVQGVKPIEEALHQVAGAYTVERTRVDAEHSGASKSAKTVFALAGALIEKTAKVADNLDKIRKAGVGTYTLAASVGPLILTWGQNLLK